MNRPPVAIVVAMAENRVIGRGGGLPWRLPADLARFRRITMSGPVVMGRRTHESIGRVLDGRCNIVVSRRPGFQAPGCIVAPSLDAALETAAGVAAEAAMAGTAAAEIAVIGGASVYGQALPHATRVHLTLVHAPVEGDVRFPELEPGTWREVSRTGRRADARNRYDVSFVELRRLRPDQKRSTAMGQWSEGRPRRGSASASVHTICRNDAGSARFQARAPNTKKSIG